jgi:chitin synthase
VDGCFAHVERSSDSLSRAHGSNRYSVVSTSETYASGSGLALSESNPLFRNSQSLASMSQYTPPEKTDGSGGRDASPASSESGGSHYKSGDEAVRVSEYSPYYPSDAYRDEAPILPPVFPSHASPDSYSHPSGYGQVPAYDPIPPSSSRGVSLVDVGPVPAGGQMAPHDPVRRVSKQQTQHRRRSSSRNDLLSPTSSASHSSQLPPGAVSDATANLSGPRLTLRQAAPQYQQR